MSKVKRNIIQFTFDIEEFITEIKEEIIGKEYKEGDTFCYICTPWGEFEAIPAALGGQLVEINAKQGSKVSKGDVIAYIQRPEAE